MAIKLSLPTASESENTSAEKIVQILLGTISSQPEEERKQIIAALMPRLMNSSGVSMCGTQFIDTLGDADMKQSLAAYVYPFAQITGGASTTVIATDENGHDCLLLIRNDAANIWSMPAGYMDPRTPFNTQGVHVKNTLHRHQYDCLFLDKGAEKAREVEGEINHLSRAASAHDATLADTAARELFEETGLKAAASQLQFVRQATLCHERKSAGGILPGQQQVNYYLLDLRRQGFLPAAQPGHDIEETQWARLADIEKQPDGSALVNGLYMRSNAVLEVEASLHFMRRKDIEAFGITWERVNAYMAAIRPQTELGALAIEWHRKSIAAAYTLQLALARHTSKRPAKTAVKKQKNLFIRSNAPSKTLRSALQ